MNLQSCVHFPYTIMAIEIPLRYSSAYFNVLRNLKSFLQLHLLRYLVLLAIHSYNVIQLFVENVIIYEAKSIMFYNIWKFYTTLEVEIGVYSKKLLNCVNPSSKWH